MAVTWPGMIAAVHSQSRRPAMNPIKTDVRMATGTPRVQ